MGKDIKCRDCDEPTWNSTERCGPCRRDFNDKVKKEKEDNGDQNIAKS